MTHNDHLLRAALLDDLAQRDVDKEGRPTEERRRLVVHALVDQAIGGNIAAIRELFARAALQLDDSSAPPRRVVLQWAGGVEPGGLDAGHMEARS